MRTLQAIERAGNRLPHPFWLFVILAGVLAVVSAVLAGLDVSAVSPGNGKTVAVRNLLSVDGVRMMLSDAVKNFASFPPLALIVIVMLGVSVADRSGGLTALLRMSLSRVSPRWVTFMLAFTGMISHVASDAAYVVLVPLGAMAFKAVGRSPILGIVVAFVSVSAGYDASPLITPMDAVLSGLSTDAARVIDHGYTVSPVSNYFFSLASSIVLTVLITVITELVVAKRVRAIESTPDSGDDTTDDESTTLTLAPRERRALRLASLAVLGAIAAITLATLPTGSPLRAPKGGLLEGAPLLDGIAFLLCGLFLLFGVVYGRVAGTISRLHDVPAAMAHGIRELAPVLVLFFAISQFLAYFKWSGIGEVTAIKGAEMLRGAGVSPVLVFLGLVVTVTLINLLVTSGSAQWALVGPVFVPMFMLLDIPPEATQALYRVADSCTNAMTPMSAYFAMTLGILQRYRKDAGIGTLFSLTMPLCVAMLVGWTLFFIAWWLLGIPLGPGAPVR
jgi:aminobenzoyl-glutamate transport protein